VGILLGTGIQIIASIVIWKIGKAVIHRKRN
jgi:hypothetical protein